MHARLQLGPLDSKVPSRTGKGDGQRNLRQSIMTNATNTTNFTNATGMTFVAWQILADLGRSWQLWLSLGTAGKLRQRPMLVVTFSI